MKEMPRIEYSPGLWYVSGQSKTGKYIIVKAGCGRTVARVPFYSEKQRLALGQAEGSTFDHGDARRIVAAVNACIGFNPEAIKDVLHELEQVFCPICDVSAVQPHQGCAACRPRRAAIAKARP